MLELGDETRKSDKQFTHSSKPAQNQQTSWWAHGWNTFGARKSHERPRTHKTHHGPDSGEATTFPHIVYFAPPHESDIRMAFLSRDSQMEVPKLPRLGVPQFCGTISSYANLGSRWGLNRSLDLVESFPMACCMPLERKGIGSIPDFPWPRVKLAIWLPTFLLAIICVANVQMGHASPFGHLCFNKFSMI
jgi:hypothetical protein